MINADFSDSTDFLFLGFNFLLFTFKRDTENKVTAVIELTLVATMPMCLVALNNV